MFESSQTMASPLGGSVCEAVREVIREEKINGMEQGKVVKNPAIQI